MNSALFWSPAQLEDLHHVGVPHLRGDAGFVQKHIDEALVARQMRQELFESDQLLKPRRSL